MKSRTVYLIVGIAAAAGAVWYLKNAKEKKVPIIMAPAGQFTATKSPVQINTLPGTLLQPTSGNTGIAPPILTDANNELPVAQAVQTRPKLVSVMIKQSDINSIKERMLLRKPAALHGMDSYLLN